MNELDLFAEAIAIADPGQRATLLDRECAGRPELRRRIEDLLNAHDKSNAMLDRTLAEPAFAVAGERSGTVIANRYKLLESIGEGGMGTVWVAEQTAPVRRKVAVKLIKAGMDSRSVIARFEAERQALAVMDHPNIAKVLDGGLTEAGRPFFVMEYVKGVPITECCDAARLSVADRLALFVQVCAAVQHAHQKGIIHRDLKPSNILVAPYDGNPVPKIIDFGLAKAMHQSLTDKTLHTAHESVLGTPLYMSPEQAQLNNLDVDTRSDIYSLGVLLYELLTGTTPLERQRFKEAAWDEVRRIIREEEPPRPSMRLSSTNTLPSLAASRHTEPLKLTRLVRGELDWIVMKALEKDRSRRYETANGLARDIGRYLSDETVEACPPSASYRLRKFARKHRAVIATTGAIAFLLVAGIAVSTWQAVRATRAEAHARQSAESERQANLEAQKSAAAEKLANAQSRKRLAQLQKGNEIITAIFADLDIRKVKEGADPLEVVLAKRLVNAAGQLEGDAVGDPLAVAELQFELANSLLNLGQWQDAKDLFVKARDTFVAKRGPDHRDAISAARSVADCYNAGKDWKSALPIWEDTLRRARATLPPDDYLTLMCMSGMASCYFDARRMDLAVPLFEESTAIIRSKKGAEHLDTLNSMNNLATCYYVSGKTEKAVSVYEEMLRLHKAKGGAEHADSMMWKVNLAACYVAAGKFDRALPMLEETLRLQKATLGAGHPNTLKTMKELANAYAPSGKVDLAIPLMEEFFKFTKAKSGPDDARALESTVNLGKAYNAAKKPELSRPMLEEALKALKAVQGDDGPGTLECIGALAVAYHKAGKLDLAIRLNDELIQRGTAKFGPDNKDVLECMVNQALVHRSAGRMESTVALLDEVFKRRLATLGPEHVDMVKTMANLAGAYKLMGKFDLATPLFEEALKLSKAKLGAEDATTLATMHQLGVCYWRLRQFDKSVPLFREALSIREEKLGRGHPETLMTLGNLGVNLRDSGRIAEAIPLLAEALKGQQATSKSDDATVLELAIALGISYRESGQSGLAAPLLERTLKTCRATLAADESQTLTCMSNLALVYRSLRKFDEAISLNDEFIRLSRAKYGNDYVDVVRCMQNQAFTYHDAGRPDLGVPLLVEVVRIRRAKLGSDHADTLFSIQNLAVCYRAAGKPDLAAPLFEEMVKHQRATLGADHADTLGSMAFLAVSLWESRQLDRSVPLFRELLALQETKLGRDHPDTLGTIGNLGVNLRDSGHFEDAVPLLEEAFRGSKKYPPLRIFGSELVFALFKAGKAEAGVKLIDQDVEDARKQLPPASIQLAGKLAEASLILLDMNRFDHAEPLLRESLAIRERKAPDVWSTFNTMSMLGGALIAQHKYADAEPMVTKGYEGLKQRESFIPKIGGGEKRIPQALERLIELSIAINRPEDAKRWQAERAKYLVATTRATLK